MRARRAMFAVLLVAVLGAIAIATGLVSVDGVVAFVVGGDRRPSVADGPSELDDDAGPADDDAATELAAGGRHARTLKPAANPTAAGGAADDPEGKPVAASSLEGTVLLADGRPATGARITLIAGDGTTISGTVDGVGHFHLDAARGRYDLLVRAGSAGSLFVRDLYVNGKPLATPLSLATPAEVRVEATQDDRPLSGAAVRLRYAPEGEPPQVVADGVTDRDGRLVADGLPAGAYVIELDVPGAVGATATRRADVSGTATIAMKLAGLGRWTGRVTDVDTGGPVPASLRLVVGAGNGTSVAGSTIADGNGVFALIVPRGRAQQVVVEHADFAPFSLGGGRLNPFASWPTADVAYDVALRRGGTVRGTVTNADSKATVSGVVLRLEPPRRGSAREATTAADGTYEAHGIAPGRWNVVVDSAGWFAASKMSFDVPDPGGGRAPPDQTFDLAVHASGRVTGRVQTADEKPVAGAHVWLIGGNGLVRAARDAGRALDTFTSDDGQFAIDDVPPADPIRVRASFADAEATPSAAIRAGDAPPPIVLVLAPTGAVRGVVLDQQSRVPVAGARVRIDPSGEPAGRGGRTVTTGTDGRFEAQALIPGAYSLVASRRRDFLPAQPATATLAAGALSAEVSLWLDPGLSISGAVTDADGKPVANARMVLSGVEDAGTPPPQVRQNQSSDGAGLFRFTGLRAGVYSIEARWGGQPRARVDRLRGGERTVVVAVPR